MVALHSQRILSDVCLDEFDCKQWRAALQMQAQACADESSLLQWLDGPLRAVYPFERCMLLQARRMNGEVTIPHLLQLGNDQQYLQKIQRATDFQQRKSMLWWLHQQLPFVIDDRCPPAHAAAFELDEIREFRLGRVAVHGALELQSSAASFFYFSGVSANTDAWHHDALRHIAPVLNTRFKKLVVPR